MIKIVINGGGGYVNDRFLGSKRQSFFIFIEGYDLIIRIILADTLAMEPPISPRPIKPIFGFIKGLPFFVSYSENIVTFQILLCQSFRALK